MDHLADAMRTERGCSEGRVLEGTASGSTEALLWVHGVTNALNPKLHYYQGKRRIPAPVILRRHAGNSIFECSRPRYWVSQRWTGTRSICIQSCRPPWSRLTGSRGSGRSSTGSARTRTIIGCSFEELDAGKAWTVLASSTAGAISCRHSERKRICGLASTQRYRLSWQPDRGREV